LATSPGSTLVIGSGVTVDGRNGALGAGSGSSAGTIINQGVIGPSVTNGWIRMATDFVNDGTLSVGGGGHLTLEAYGWTNRGAIVANGGTLDSGGYNYLWSNTGAINVTNSAVNLGGTFTLAGLGTFNRS